MRLRILDFVAIAVSALAVGCASIAVYGGGDSRPQLVISGAEGEWIYPLDADREVEVAGPLGSTVICVEGKRVHIEDSPCPNKTCVAAGWIDRPGQWLSCLPNQVFVRIEGGPKDEGGVDAGAF